MAHDNQIDVLDDRLDRVALDVLGQGQLLLALDINREESVGVLQGHHRGVARESDVDRRGAMPIDHRRDIAGTADTARRALAELGALLSGKLVLCHENRSPAGRVVTWTLGSRHVAWSMSYARRHWWA